MRLLIYYGLTAGICEAKRSRGASGRLEGLIPRNSATLSRVFAVEEHGRELFEAAQRLDLEGIVAKRKRDPYTGQTSRYKVKNPAYTQAEGRGDLFHRPQ